MTNRTKRHKPTRLRQKPKSKTALETTVRLQKYIADCGVMSRRAAEEAISARRVKVNGLTAELGQKITPGTDEVLLDGAKVSPRLTPYTYLALNKPRGIVSTARDEKGRPCVTDLVRHLGIRLYPVGRLDMDSDGLLLLTDDGRLAERLTHPSHTISKTYHVTLREETSDALVKILSSPMTLDGYRLKPVEVKKLGEHQLEMILHEGRNRQIRRMCETAGVHVTRLTRVAIGSITLGHLRPGAFRSLRREEIESLLN